MPAAWMIVLIVLLSASTALADSKTRIMWLKNNAPPFYFHAFHNSTPAFGDALQHMLQQELTQYAHSDHRIPLSRLQYYWGSPYVRCFSTMIHGPPINPHYAVSRPNVLYPPLGLVTTRTFAKTHQLLDKDSVSLETILQIRDLRLGEIKGRTYGETLDSILARHRDKLTVIQRPGGVETQGILNMLRLNRFDIMLEYEFIIDYYRDHEQAQVPLHFTPISEMQGTYIPGAIGCSNNIKGHEVLHAINLALEKLVNREAYRANISRWLVPEDRAAAYWQAYEEQIIRPSETTLPAAP